MNSQELTCPCEAAIQDDNQSANGFRRFQENSYSHDGREKSRPYENMFVGSDGIITVRRNVELCIFLEKP